MKITIELDDTLQDRVNSAIAEVKQCLLDYLKENPDTDKVPCLSNDLDYSGSIHEIIDWAVPVYTHEIEATFFLHGDDVEQAFEDAGIGEKEDKCWPNGWKPAAIYCYIQSKVNEWYSKHAEAIFDEWKASKKD